MALPHTSYFAQRSIRYIESTAFYRRHGFRFRVVTQPAQSPDLNVLDLCFWNSNKKTLKGKNWSTMREMIDDVETKWKSYDPSKVEAAFRILYAVYRGILRTFGDNNFDRKLRRLGNGPLRVLNRVLYDKALTEIERLIAAENINIESDHLGDAECEDSDNDNEVLL